MVVRLSAGCPLPRRRFLVLIAVRGLVDPRAIVWLEGLGQMKNPMTSSGTEPVTLRLVAWCLNHLRYRVPRSVGTSDKNVLIMQITGLQEK
jgi:hypothetical protein